MRIERLKIEGFGRFQEWELTLAPGLNVVCGPNEAGKSTLLSFIRSMLFGFSKRNEPGRYEPERGAFGGELVVNTDSGTLCIRRWGSRRYEGDLWVQALTGERASPARLFQALGGISRQLFFQVFAFGLDELASFEELADEGSVSEALFAAGMRGAKRLPFAVGELRRLSQSLFAPKGKRALNQVLSELEEIQEQLAAIGDRPARYFEARAQLKALERDLEAAEGEWGRLSRERSDVARLCGTLEDLQHSDEVELELRALPRLEAFPSDAAAKLDDFLARLAQARAEADAAAAEREGWSGILSGILIPEALSAAEPALRAALLGFQSRLEQFRSLSQRGAALAQTRRQVEASLHSFGFCFDAADLAAIDLGSEAKERLLALRSETERAREQIALGQQRQRAASEVAEDAQRAAAAIDAPGRVPREFFSGRILGLLLSLVVALGLAAAAFWGGVIGFSACALSALLAAVLWTLQRRASAAFREAMAAFQDRREFAERQRASAASVLTRAAAEKGAAEADEATAREELASLERELEKWLADRKLPSGLSAERAVELWLELASLQRRVRDLGVDEHSLAVDRHQCDVAAAQLVSAARVAGLACSGAEEAVAASSAALDRMAHAHQERRRLSERLEANALEVDRAARRCAELERAVAALLDQVGCATQLDLRVRDRQAGAFRALSARARELALRIEAASGMRIEAVREEVRKLGGPAAIPEALAALEARLARVSSQKAALAERRGSLRMQLRTWEDDREIAAIRSREELQRAKALELAEKYAVDRLALGLLSRAQRRYEREQQPRILKLASRGFRELTAGRYLRVHARAPKPGALFVSDVEGREWPAEQLSRGTREQLYLAFRLAVIEEFGESRSPLPIILDDVLVNFDRQRARNAVKVLARLSARHQVIAFTCHLELRDLFSDQGARTLEIAAARQPLLAETA